MPDIFDKWDHPCPEYEWEINHVDIWYGYECICGRPSGGCCTVQVDLNAEPRTIEIPPNQKLFGVES